MTFLSDPDESDDSCQFVLPPSRDNSDTVVLGGISTSDSPSLQGLISERDRLLEALESSSSDSEKTAKDTTDHAAEVLNKSEEPTLLKYIDDQCHSIFPDWSAPLLFPKSTDESSDITKFADKRFKKDVLLDKTFSHHHYFCQNTNPIYGGFVGDVFKKLCKDISRAAIYSGFEVFKNGRYPAKYLKLSDCQRFSCCKCKTFVSQRSDSKESSAFRKTSYHQDKLNSRGSNGKKMSRRCNTKRTKLSEHKCRYFFLLHYDDNGYFMVPGIDETNHQFCPKFGH